MANQFSTMLLRLFSGKKTVLLNEWYCDNWVATQNEVGSVAHPYTTVNSKLIKDLNIRIKTIKFLQLNIEVRVMTLDLVMDFLDMTPKA